MSLKRVLGMMLASRMGGRGRRRGALGTAGVLGGLGRGGMSRKLGVAALGYMAYQAYRDHQARSAGPGTAQGAQGGGVSSGRPGTAGQQGLGGIGDMIRDVADRITGGAVSGGAASVGTASQGAASAHGGARADTGHDDPGEAAFGDDERKAADAFSENKALLLLRAMITAAYSDGALSQEERMRIMGEIDASGDAEDRRIMEREIANPRPLDELLGQVHDHETAEEFYLASRAAIDGGTQANRDYLARLRERLRITDAEAAEVEEIAS